MTEDTDTLRCRNPVLRPHTASFLEWGPKDGKLAKPSLGTNYLIGGPAVVPEK